MDWLLNINWDDVLAFQKSPLEIFIRGTLVYLALFALLRLMRREAGAVGITDLLVIVLIADASQNAMAADYQSIPDGILLVVTIIFWDFTLDWLAYKFPLMEQLVHAKPLPLIKHGRMLRNNMRSELITVNELLGQLRQQGIEHISEVKYACLEGDGKVSIIKFESEDSPRPKDDRAI